MTDNLSDVELNRIIHDPYTCFDDVHRKLAAELLELRAELRTAVPTPWAYEQACKALEKHRARADQAEQDRDDARAAIYVVQAVHERQLAQLAADRAKAERKIARLAAAAAPGPPTKDELDRYLAAHGWTKGFPGTAGTMWHKGDISIGMLHNPDDQALTGVLNRLARAEWRNEADIAAEARKGQP